MNRHIRRALTFLIALILPVLAFAQGNPVSWSYNVNKIQDGLLEVVFNADIEPGWHMYDMGPYKGGPNPTVFTVEATDTMELDGDVQYVTQPKRKMDDIYGMEIGYFEDKASFSQKVKVSNQAPLKVNVEWMCCNDGTCIPPDDQDFTIWLCSDGETVPYIIEDDFAPDTVLEPEKTKKAGGPSIWSLILQAIAWGIAALATPCVFPMIPMTVSYFIKGSEDKKKGRFRAFMYGLFIVLLYTVPIALIIFLTWLIGGNSVTTDIFNWLATHWLPNIIFFIVFMVFAASFFGAFEIVMPSSLVNKSDKKSDKAGLGGIFFMALTLVLVSFSCTGPIVGTVLIKSTSGEFWAPMLTMLAFSAAFALPFTLFALFPSWLKKLPKSGGWLNTVKVVLGFIEVALGFKFLSTADQTYQWGLLDREVYLAIWIVCFALLGFYLLGKLRFKNDDPVEHISVTRLALAIATFSFVVYMIPGMWGAPLKAISGYLPPMQTQDFVLGQESAAPAYRYNPADGFPEHVKYGDSGLKLPHGLKGFFDLDEAEAYAESVDKPVFIDVTGLGCMNCREMEARVLSDPEILDMLRNDYVVVALFGDEKSIEVDSKDWVTTEGGKVLKTLGKVNSYYVQQAFGVNGQPFYILKGHGRMLAEPRSYNLDVDAFREFLRDGIKAYKEGI